MYKVSIPPAHKNKAKTVPVIKEIRVIINNNKSFDIIKQEQIDLLIAWKAELIDIAKIFRSLYI